MKKSRAKTTTAQNLEEKFERGEDILDYFDPVKAKVIEPQSPTERSQRNANESTVVREDSPE